MGEEVVKQIKVVYSETGLAEQYRTLQQYNAELRQLVTTQQKMNSGGAWTTLSTTTKENVKSQSALSGALNSTMMRFIGLNAIISQGTKLYQEMRQYIDESVQSFRAFEYRIGEVRSIIDATEQSSIPALQAGVENLSVQFGKSVQDLGKGLYQIISAAIDIKDAMSILTVATRTAIAGLTSVEDAALTLTEVINAYGLSASNAERISDTLFEAVIRGNFTFQDLTTSLGYVIPIAANAGVAFEDVMAAMSSATRQGQKLDSVTRGLGLLIQNISNPTKQASDAAKKYGIEMDATSLSVDGLSGFITKLSEAVSKYGMSILPELIGNMRSLRVVMALAGQEGIQGFTEDLELMANAAGKTDDALARMMNTQKTMADIISQSLENVNRDLGKVWTDVDLGWKKVELWMKTLLVAGFDKANETIQELNASILTIKENYLKSVIESTSGTKASFADMLMGEVKALNEANKKIVIEPSINFSKLNISKNIDFSKIKQYYNLTDTINTTARLTEAGLNAGIAFDILGKKIQSAMPSFGTPGYKDLTKLKELKFDIDSSSMVILNTELKKMGMETITGETNIKEFNTALNTVKSNTDLWTDALTRLTDQQANLQSFVDDVESGLDTLNTDILNHEMNIISLQKEIKDLNELVSEPYKGYANKSMYNIAVAEAEQQMNNFQEYSKMASKYGEDYINEWTNVVDQYGNNMSDVLKTIYEYNQATEVMTEKQNEAKHAMDELGLAMQKNNLMMLKLELIGMIRRRGNTRSEQQAMKKIQIENTKIRIEQMQIDYDAQVAQNEAVNAIQQDAYEDAKTILDDYAAYQEYIIWKMKDTRDEDIQNMRDELAYSQQILKIKEGQLKSEYIILSNEANLYYDVVSKISEKLGDEYTKFFGEDAIVSAQKSYADYLDFLSKNPPPSGSGINVPTQPPGNTPSSPGNTTPPSSGIKTIPPIKVIGKGPQSDVIKKITGGRFYSRGTWDVPETGQYMLHKYEQVRPGDEKSGSIGSITINIPVQKVGNDGSPQKIAAAVRQALDAKFMSYDVTTGKLNTKYRHR